VPRDGPELIIVSTGSEQENRAMGLRARIALNPGFTVGAAFGASGTPSAILLDDRGHVAGPLGVGGPAVQFDKLFRDDYDKYARLVKELHIHVN